MNEGNTEISTNEEIRYHDVSKKRRTQVILIFFAFLSLFIMGWSIAFAVAFLIPPPDIAGYVNIGVSAFLFCLAVFLVIMIIRINKKIKVLKGDLEQIKE